MCKVLLVLLLAAPAAAQETQPLAWSDGRRAADWISTGLVAGQLGAETRQAWRAADRRAALGCLGWRVGLTVGVAELTKRLVHRERPDGSDRHSFYSEHTALAVVATGWRVQVSVPVAIGAGYLRMGAGKHYATDVAVGAIAGLVAREVCHGR